MASGGLFTLSGTTVSTSGGHGGHGTTYYRVSGNASMSGSADAGVQGDVYQAEMWLEVSSKDAAGVPGRGNIQTNKKDANGAYYDVYSTSTGAVLSKNIK